jgi:hypothetical protein
LSHKDARVHCVVLNIRAALPHTRHLPNTTRGARGFDRKERSKAVNRPEGIRSFRPSLQDPTTCQTPTTRPPAFHRPTGPRRSQARLVLTTRSRVSAK